MLPGDLRFDAALRDRNAARVDLVLQLPGGGGAGCAGQAANLRRCHSPEIFRAGAHQFLEERPLLHRHDQDRIGRAIRLAHGDAGASGNQAQALFNEGLLGGGHADGGRADLLVEAAELAARRGGRQRTDEIAHLLLDIATAGDDDLLLGRLRLLRCGRSGERCCNQRGAGKVTHGGFSWISFEEAIPRVL
jgi:hypothetical protein